MTTPGSRGGAGPFGSNPDSPPDSADPSGPCPRCGRVSTFSNEGSAPVTFEEGRYAINRDGSREGIAVHQVSVLGCRGCGQRVVVIEEAGFEGVPLSQGGTRSGRQSWHGMHWWPPPTAGSVHASVPEALRESYAEGLRCHGVRAFRAAVVMFRRCLEGIVEAKGSPEAQGILASRGPGKIAKAIDQMVADGDLTKELGEWAHEVRLVGNEGGHWDPLDAVTADDANSLSNLVSGLFDYLFILPANLRARRQSQP